MGQPPPSKKESRWFRFTKSEVEQLNNLLHGGNNAKPTRDEIQSLVAKFNSAPERIGNRLVQDKQVDKWFRNWRWRKKKGINSGVSTPIPTCTDLCDTINSNEGSSAVELSTATQYEFEARSSRDGAWYDVALFLEHRTLVPDQPEVRVRFKGYGAEHDEWVNVRAGVRQRSVPCEDSDCTSIDQGDCLLCFRECGKEAVYFDAVVLKVERRRHDARGCRCKFLMCYEHDDVEEKLPIDHLYKRPNTGDSAG